MNSVLKRILSAVCISLCIIFSSGRLIAKTTSSECPPEGCPAPKEPGEGDEGDYKYEETVSTREAYKRLYYVFGLGGSYFTKKNDLGLKGNVGAYTNIEYRFSRIASAGFSSYYGYQMGEGNQYWSTFNPEIKIFPMTYKNPSFEPFIFIGGHVFETLYGSSDYGKVGYGQGAFGGIGARFCPESAVIGFEGFVRGSALWMKKPDHLGGHGRSLTIPIFAFVGVVY